MAYFSHGGGVILNLKMKILSIAILVLTMMLGLTACGSVQSDSKSTKTSEAPASGGQNTANNKAQETNEQVQPRTNEQSKGIKVKITVGDQVLTATLIDNETTRSLIAKFPLTLPMMDLYSREMCYRFSESLPANEEQTSGYEVGDISYWTPRHSFVIFYKQNGEVIGNLQKIGHIDSGVEVFRTTGDANVRFELLDK